MTVWCDIHLSIIQLLQHTNHVYGGNLKQSLYSQWIVHLFNKICL